MNSTRMPATSCRRQAEPGSSDGERRGGANVGGRVIYYFYNELIPLFLLSVFAKYEKANLTKAERNEMKALLPRLVAGYQRRTGK